MQRTALFLAFVLSLAVPPVARAAILLDEPFSYPDGPLTLVSGGRWATHAGTSNQLAVVSGQAALTQSDSEDVSAALAGGPYRGPALYAGFTLTFSQLPTGAGTYFAHFKDGTSTGFRGRVHAATNGAAPGRYRLGVASGAGVPVWILSDLDLATPYAVVLRYDSGTAASTLWIHPAGENDTRQRADADDATTTLSITSFSLRESLSTGNGMGTLTLDGLKVATSFVEAVDSFNPRLDPPALSHIPDQTIPANTSTPVVPFVVQDAETAAEVLLVTATSDNQGLVGTSGVVFGGGGSNRTVTVTPTPGRQGATRITVTVKDADGNTANGTFQVTVGVPTLSAIPDQVVPRDNVSGAIPFTLGDAEGDVLAVSAASTNTAVLPLDGIRFAGSAANRTLQLTPAPGLTGLSLVTLFVTDGFNTASNSFLVTVYPARGTILRESFAYPDGSVTTNSQFTWMTHSGSLGQTGQTKVVQGRLVLSGAQGEDIHALLAAAPYAPKDVWVLYARFTVNFATRPSGGGDYFAHFRGASSGSGARVLATATGAAAGNVRVGLAGDATATDAILPIDLATNTTHSVVTRYNVATGQATLWVDPVSEHDPAAQAIDLPAPFEVWSYAFRQATGIGTMAVDDLVVTTSFAEAVSPGYQLRVERQVANVIVAWPQAARADGYRVQSLDVGDPDTWFDVGSDGDPVGSELILQYPPQPGYRLFRLAR